MLAAPAQLRLDLADLPVKADEAVPEGLWESLPAAVQTELLSLFARLIARGVLVDQRGEGEVVQ